MENNNVMAGRLESWDWRSIEQNLDESGFAKTPGLLTSEECVTLIKMYPEAGLFRNRVDMAQFRFGDGEYKYFSYELPELIQDLRASLYPRLVQVANCWNEKLNLPGSFPPTLPEFLDHCHISGQTKPN